ncbi:UNVERIFIED_CONTAM: hypothetical protein RMT77_014180 [Armadillidium vulgare]|nr:cytochrome c oxidase assembly protein COX16-like protein, mitochondrial [Armadillidium vulgare]
MSTKNSHFVRYGLPLLVLVIGGSFGLKQFTSIKYEYNQKKLFREVAAKEGIDLKPASEVTLEKAFEEIQEIDTTNWENKRGPRPWEENNQLFAEAVERGKNLQKKKE